MLINNNIIKSINRIEIRENIFKFIYKKLKYFYFIC